MTPPRSGDNYLPMRTIVFGVGAIGGTVAAGLALAGQEVAGIARGDQLAAIRQDGLLLRHPTGSFRARFPCVSHPGEVDLRPDDVVILAMKSQHTLVALEQLREAGLDKQPVFCAQNGVANEREALRRFPNVHGITVMMPASFSVPGEVNAFSTPRLGIFDIGRYPAGRDADDDRAAVALEAGGIATFVSDRVMERKYGKLLMNLGNVVEAALGTDAKRGSFQARLRAEAEAVLAAASIPWRDMGASDPRRQELMRQGTIEGIERIGGSSTQSLARGTGSIETDWLNGEIVLLGRLHGVPAPLNAWFQRLAARLVREGLPPGALTPGELEAGLATARKEWEGSGV